MNIRNHVIEIHCGHRDINDVAQALIHSLLFFRTHGKFNYKHEGSYSIGTLGYERVTAANLDFSYIRCSSASLTSHINGKIQEIVSKLNGLSNSVTLTVEFYTRKPNRWPFNDSKIVWELWNIKLMINTPSGSAMSLEDLLSQKLMDMVRIVNNEKFSLPQMPTQPNLDFVFDTTHTELQPYLYNISYKIVESIQSASNMLADSSTQSSLKKFLLGTLEL